MKQKDTIDIKTKEKINLFDFIKTNWKKILIIILCSAFYSFGNIMFLVKASSIPSGLSSISITLSYIFVDLKPYLTIIYLVLNIPLFVFFWNKLKKKFLLLTIIFLSFNALFGFIFGFGQINDFLSNNVFNILPNINDFNIEDLIKDNKSGATTPIVFFGWPIFIYLAMTLIFTSPFAAFVWKLGASTGGTDIIAHYYSTKKKKDVGYLLMIIGYVMATASLLVMFLMKNYGSSWISKNINGFKIFFGLQTWSSFAYILVNGLLINMLYPKYKKVIIHIDTKDPKIISKWLIESEYWHPYKIKESISGYTKKPIYTISSIVLLLESDDIVENIKKVDPSSWISVSPISKIHGRFNYSKVE